MPRLSAVSIHILADLPHLIDAVGDLRWREWGHPPEPVDRDWWLDTTRREAGRETLPVTWVAVDGTGHPVGAVGLNEFDIEERLDRSPWVIGMITEAARRGQGTGSRLMAALETWAAQRGYPRLWVATDEAEGFYRKCGWETVEVLTRVSGERIVVLKKALLRVRDAGENDLEALTRIKPSKALHRDRIRDAQGEGFRYLVVEKDGEVAGFGCLVFTRPAYWSDAGDTTCLPMLVDIHIAPTRQGQGCGTFLIKSMEEFAARDGSKEIYLSVDPLNNPRAHALYLRLGYRALQGEPYLKHWEFVDSSGMRHAGDNWIFDMSKRIG